MPSAITSAWISGSFRQAAARPGVRWCWIWKDFNALRAEREPWLVIDPKPLVGEREIDGGGLLRNAEDPTLWLDALAGLGYNRERAWAWGFAHALAWDNLAEAERIYSARG